MATATVKLSRRETLLAPFPYLLGKPRVPAISIADILSTLVPKDASVRRTARDVSYGPIARQKLDIYEPERRDQQPLPVIVFFYGGAWSDGSRAHYAFAAHALASLGYIVVVPDYRLVPHVEYPGFLEDCAEAVAWVSQNIAAYGGDRTRVVLAGHSAGAYNAMMLGLDRKWLSPAIRDCIAGVIGLSGPYDFFPFDGEISQRVFGKVEDPQGTQPINHVGTSSPPVLLISGGRDELVLPRNSLHLGAAVTQAGGEAKVLVYPRLAHAETLLALSLPLRWIAPVRRECRAFLAAVTGQGSVKER